MRRVVVSGGTGFVGRALCAALEADGYEVHVLTRDPERARQVLPPGAIAHAWSAGASSDMGGLTQLLAGATAVVHLAGEPVAQRWTEAVKARVRKSRVDSTAELVGAMAKAEPKPQVFVCASAIGYYGARDGDEPLDEGASPGRDFLAEVVVAWEAAAQRAEELGVRTVRLRVGIVLGEGGGALEQMLLPFKLFAGGPIADGAQVVSWVHRDDVIGLVRFVIAHDEARGPINAVAPNPVTNAELARAIGVVLGRRSWLRVPRFAVRLRLGEAAEFVVTGQRVVPARALDLGYSFEFPTLEPALSAILR